MILIDALFIANNGGGPNLLRYLLDSIKKVSKQDRFFLLLDERFQHDVSGFQYLRMKGSLTGRYKFYRQNRNKFSRVFCFANTPPPVKLKVPVSTYFHNQMLLESTRHLLDKRYSRFYLRYLFVKLFNRHTDYYLVQTSHMVDEIVATKLKDATHCKLFPFYEIKNSGDSAATTRTNDFVYISAASFYKNHMKLLKAWEYLYKEGRKPVLHLTVSDNAEVLEAIDLLQKKGLQIINHGYIDPAHLYSNSSFMIYPSLNESFGLSLVEGAEAGIKILAADLPYVRSVISASAYFNPLDAADMAQTVSKALENTLPFPEILVKNEVYSLIDYLTD